MRKHVKTLVVVLATPILVGAFVGNSQAQVSPANDPVLRACERAIDELAVKRVEVEGLTEQLRLMREQSTLKDQLIVTLSASAEFWKTAATERKEALSLDARIDQIRVEQIAEYRDELARLRSENEKLRRSRTKWFLGGLVLGAVAPKIP